VVLAILFFSSCEKRNVQPPPLELVKQWTRSSYASNFVSNKIEPSQMETIGNALWVQESGSKDEDGYGFILAEFDEGASVFHKQFGVDPKDSADFTKAKLSDGRLLLVTKWMFSESSDYYVAYSASKKGSPDLVILLNVPARSGLPQGVSPEEDLIEVYRKAYSYFNE